MRFLHLLSAAPLAAAFVVPNQEVFAQIATEDTRKEPWTLHKAYGSVKDEIKDVGHRLSNEFDTVKHAAQRTLDTALENVHELESKAEHTLTEDSFDAQGWASSNLDRFLHRTDDRGDHPPHHGPPHDGPPHDGPPHRRPHKKHPHHHKPNQTVYELIASSKYTTKLAKLINDYPDLVEALNGTKANYTVFAPTDRAFEKIPEKAPKPSKEFLKKLLTYHVSDQFYPAGRVLGAHTIPTLLEGDELGEKPYPAQRVSVNLGLRGLTLNYYARVVAIDIFGTNGVIHGLDSLLIPPPRTLKIIDLFPAEFSTLSLALLKTELLPDLADNPTVGGTFFAPSNNAFGRLGPRLNAFLFSEHGLKYLKALLKYHIVPTTTVYSDAIYPIPDEDDVEGKRRQHLDLPTLLEDKRLSVDIASFARFTSIRVNGFSEVRLADGVARDGVVHVINNVLVPGKVLADGGVVPHTGEEMCVGEFKSRMEPYLE